MLLPVASGSLNVGERLVTGLFNPHPDDPARYSQNQAWYTAALQGDQSALRNLLSHSGQYGAALWLQRYPGQPNPGGWATDGPRQDAWNKYLGATGGAGAPGGAVPSPSTVGTTAGPSYQLTGTKTLGQQVLDFFGLGPASQAQIAQSAGVAAGQQVAGGIVQAAVIVAVVIVAIVLLRRR